MKPAHFLVIYVGVAVFAVFLFIRFGSTINDWVSSPHNETNIDQTDIATLQTNMQQANINRRIAVRSQALQQSRSGGVSSMAAASKDTVKRNLEFNASGLKELVAVSSETPSNAPVLTNGATISISALIDGVSVLLFHENNARWYHDQWAAPGREKGGKDPTIINGKEWFPAWQNDSNVGTRYSLRNDNCHCYSSINSDLDVQFPQKAFEVKIKSIDVRGTVDVLLQPTSSNDCVTAILFDDNQTGGSTWFEIELEVVLEE